MPFGFGMESRPLEGEHEHEGSNLGGLHVHPKLGINTPGGVHDHGIDFWGVHLHRGADERMQVHVGGMHLHSSEEGEEFSDHIHNVLGALGYDGNPLSIEVAKSEGRIAVRKGLRQDFNEEVEEESAVEVMKSFGAQECDFEGDTGWVILYSYEGIPGCYLADFAKSGHTSKSTAAVGEKKKGKKFSPKTTRQESEEIAKEFAKVFGEVDLCRIRGRVGDSILVEKAVTYTVSNPISLEKLAGGKKRSELPDSDKADNFKKSEADGAQAPAIQSVVLTKGEFPTKEGALSWIQKNGFSCKNLGETFDSWIFLQKSSDREAREQILGTGVVANIEMGDSVEVCVPFTKVDKAERTVEGIVYKPYVFDSDDEFMHPEDIQAMAWSFMRKSRQGNIDAEHDEVPRDCAVVESFIAKANDPHYPVGAWVVKTKIFSNAIWKGVEDGTYNGYSMGGMGTKVMGVELPEFPSLMIGKTTGEGERVSLAKSFDFDFDLTGGVRRKKKGNRLIDVDVQFLSFVKAGANKEDFKFKKSAGDGEVVIFKSRDLRLFDGDHPIAVDGTLTKLIKGMMSALGFGGDSTNESGPVVAPEERKVEPMPKKEAAGFVSLVTALAKRAGDAEAVLVELAKSQALAPVIQANPKLQGLISQMNPTELQNFASEIQKFAVGQADFMEIQGNNGVSLPSVENFFGFVQSMANVQGFMQGGGFPGGGTAPGSFSGQSGQALEKGALVDGSGAPLGQGLDPTSPSTPAEGAKRAGETTVDAMTPKDDSVFAKSIGDAISGAVAAAMAPIIQKMEGMQAEVDTVKKAAGGAETPAVAGGLAADTTPGATPPPADANPAVVSFTDSSALDTEIQEDIRKGRLTAKNPFGGVGDLNGIRLDGTDAAGGVFLTDRQVSKQGR